MANDGLMLHWIDHLSPLKATLAGALLASAALGLSALGGHTAWALTAAALLLVAASLALSATPKVVPLSGTERRWLLGVVALVGAGGAYLALRAPPERPPVPDIVWVAIEGGRFEMGSDKGQSDEQPIHTVTVPSFELAKSEVTVAQYARCVAASACTEPDTGESCNWGVAGREQHPVNCVDWKQAKAFSAWVGGRLPTEAEWEYAARSRGKAQTYPWGDERATCARAVMNGQTEGKEGDTTRGCGRGSTWPVCAKPAGNSEQQVCDLAGNVWEWVEDAYVSDYEQTPRDGSAQLKSGSLRVFRGGGWDYSAGDLRAANRLNWRPGVQLSVLGFRPARTRP